MKLRQVIIALVILVFFGCMPFVGSTHNTQLMTESLVLAVSAMGFTFLYGYTGLASMAQMAYFAVSAYTVAIMTVTYSQNYWFAAVAGIVFAVVTAAIFGLLAYRTEGIYFLMMTLALSQVAYSAFLQLDWITGGFRGFSGVGRPNIGSVNLVQSLPRYYLFLVLTILVYVLLKYVSASKYGVALIAGKDSGTKLCSLGMDVRRQRFTAHIIAGFIAGIAGVMGIMQYGVVSPATTGLIEILKVIMASIIGGALWLEGGVLGSFIVVYLISVVSAQTQRYWMIIGAVFVLAILLLPDGIMGGAKNLIYKIKTLKSKPKKKIV